jgi:hypothetical protein
MTTTPVTRGKAAFWCGLASATAALLAGLFYLGWPPGATSGEAMLLLVFGAFPLGVVGLALALLTLVVVLLVVALVWLSWSRCASSCI